MLLARKQTPVPDASFMSPVAFCAFPYFCDWVPNDHFWAEDTRGACFTIMTNAKQHLTLLPLFLLGCDAEGLKAGGTGSQAGLEWVLTADSRGTVTSMLSYLEHGI